MAYSASVGVTTNVDMGEFVVPGTRNVKDSFVFDGLACWDPFAIYSPSSPFTVRAVSLRCGSSS